MPKIRIVVEFSVPKGEAYRHSRRYLYEALIKAGWPANRFALMNVGNIVAAAITKERARVKATRVVGKHPALGAPFNPDDPYARMVEQFELTRPDGSKDDSLRRAMVEAPKFGATLEFDGPLPDFLRPDYVAPPPKIPWWRRLFYGLMGDSPDATVSGTFTQPGTGDQPPVKISFTGLDRYRK